MKEIIAIIRRHKLEETKSALTGLGYYSLTIQSIEGRGKQKGVGGLACELDPELYKLVEKEGENAHEGRISFIPKRIITMVVEDKCAARVVQAIIKVNQTGNIGDGKIFVCPIAETVRIRTDERQDQALL